MDSLFKLARKRNIDGLKAVRSKRHVTRNSSGSLNSSGGYMKELSCLLIGTLVVILLLPVPVFAVDISGPMGSIQDPLVSAISINPVITTAPSSVIINPRVVRTIITPQATGVLIFESVPTNASVYVDGTLKGTTPLTLRTITTGSHEVSFRLAGYQNYTTKVTVTAGTVATVSGTLSPVITETVTRTVSPSVSVTSRSRSPRER